MSKKRFVIDTSVLLNDPTSIYKFGDNEVILPITVIEELDNFKKDQREVGRNSRQVARYLDKYMKEGDLVKGIVVNEQGGILRVDVRYQIDSESLPHDVNLPLDYNKNDNRIINCAYINDAVIVSRDINLRIMAESYKIPSEDYKNDKIEIDDSYTGAGELSVTANDIQKIYDTGFLPVTGFNVELYPNKFFLLTNECNEKQSALAVYDSILKELRLLVTDDKIMGIEARNMEQYFALNALCDPDVKLVTLIGKAGCGKSLMALAAGLQCVTQGKDYTKLLVYRPVVPMGNDIGFLPGTKEEKLGPWMQAISDNIDFIMADAQAEDRPKIKKPKKTAAANKNDIPILGEKDAGKVSRTQELVQFGFLEMDATTYIRGRSIPNMYIIVDEAQNMSPHEIKTIITRAGEGTKIVLTGDPSQIDSPYLDATNNGLTFVAERFKNEKIAAHVLFDKSERSELAEIAANIL